MLPVAALANARFGERARARAIGVWRAMRGSLVLSTLAIAGAVGAVQATLLFVIHEVTPTPALCAAFVVVLASLACLWVGTFAFVRLVTRRGGAVSAVITTAAFYGLSLPLGTDDALLTVLGLVPAAALAAPLLVRMPWPAEPQRPTLPCG